MKKEYGHCEIERHETTTNLGVTDTSPTLAPSVTWPPRLGRMPPHPNFALPVLSPKSFVGAYPLHLPLT